MIISEKRYQPTEIKIEEDWLGNYRVKIKTINSYKRYIIYCSWFCTIQDALDYCTREFRNNH